MQRIVVGVDGSQGARRALEWAVAEARLRDAHVVVVHAWVEPAAVAVGSALAVGGVEPEIFEETAERIVADVLSTVDTTGLAQAVESHVVAGAPARALLDAAKEAAMIVVGSRGLGGFTGLLLGSVSQQVAHHATCPVVIIPSHR
ncbi:MAG TPA: universal stress protein [Acidimicrobiales bacterium]|jgi:nucleotide-binding universal stress UspA family protein|nr:universal stress protein [Acidimicrobiales bacterium]